MMTLPLQTSLRDASSPKGAPLGNAASFTAYRKAVPLGKVDASETSRRKGRILCTTISGGQQNDGRYQVRTGVLPGTRRL
jgi:hypothetical protein